MSSIFADVTNVTMGGKRQRADEKEKGEASQSARSEKEEKNEQLAELDTQYRDFMGAVGRTTLALDRRVRDLEAWAYHVIQVAPDCTYISKAMNNKKQHQIQVEKKTTNPGPVHCWAAAGILEAWMQDADVNPSEKEVLKKYEIELIGLPNKLDKYVNQCTVKISHDKKHGIITIGWPNWKVMEQLVVSRLTQIAKKTMIQAAPRGPGPRAIQASMETLGLFQDRKP